MWFDVFSWLVWGLPLLSSIFVIPIARFSSKARDYFAIMITLVTTLLSFSLIFGVQLSAEEYFGSSAAWIPSFGITAGVFVDPLGVLFAVLIAFFGLIISVYSLGYMKGEKGLTRYYFFLLLFIGSMIGLVLSDNFLQIFIFWEMVGLCSYSLISFWYKRQESIQAGAKVFLMTRIGDVSLLAAIGLLYANLGSFSFRYAILNIGTIPTPTLTIIAFLVLGGAIAKSAQLPLHTWLYGAMEAPTSVSALLHSATMVKAGIYLVARFLLILGPLAYSLPMWLPSIVWIGVLTAFVGATLAFYTSDIKGVLAYSTISQLGFMMAALGTVSLHSQLGWFASLFHMMSHAFFEGLGFLLAGCIIHSIGTRDMRLMGGLRKAMPVTFILSVIMILTTSGLPPFAAFFSKGLIITSLIETGNWFQVGLIYFTAALTFAYSLRFITLIFMGKKSEFLKSLHLHESSKIMLAPAVVLGILCVVWGLIGPQIGGFMRIEEPISLVGAFLSLETLSFFTILIPTGLIIYLTYYKKSEIMTRIRNSSNIFTTILKHEYFFDDFYRKIVSGGIERFSTNLSSGNEKVINQVGTSGRGILYFSNIIKNGNEKVINQVGTSGRGILYFSKVVQKVEVSFFSQFPKLIADFIVKSAHVIKKYIEVSLDELLGVLAHRTLHYSSKIKTVPQTSLQHYIVAALIGFILIVVLVLIAMGV